jgi:hypothetical protein
LLPDIESRTLPVKKVVFDLPKVHAGSGYRDWSDGVMECWKKDINPLASSPLLRHSSNPKASKIEIYLPGLPTLRLKIR